MKKDIRKPGWKITVANRLLEFRGTVGTFEDEYVKVEYHQHGSKSLNGHVSRVELMIRDPEYRHQMGKECLDYCNGQEGPCHFCGTEGLCCRYDEIRDINSGCKGQYVMYPLHPLYDLEPRLRGQIITGKHVCTSREAPETANLGEECWKKCGDGKEREGQCNLCGSKGKCCRRDERKDSSSGCAGQGCFSVLSLLSCQ